jgi:lysophospholipase L1-like esterase
MHARMARHTTEGFLCWDKVHFTSFGYGRLAEHFADALAPLLEEAGSARR